MTENAIVVASKRGLSADLGDETIVLDTDAGEYWSLNPVGARIWELIREPLPVHRVVSVLLEEYDVSPECCAAEVGAVLQQMEKAGLVDVRSPGDVGS